MDECGETFYGRHTAQRPAAVTTNNNDPIDPLRAKKINPPTQLHLIARVMKGFRKELTSSVLIMRITNQLRYLCQLHIQGNWFLIIRN